MDTAVKDHMVELGKLGGKLSGVARRNRHEIQDVARKVLNMKVKYPGPLKNMLDGVGIDTTRKPSLIAAIFATFAMRALTGDLKSAYFVMDVSGYSLKAKERKAKIDMLQSMMKNPDLELPQEAQPIDMEEMEKQAKMLGVYDVEP